MDEDGFIPPCSYLLDEILNHILECDQQLVTSEADLAQFIRDVPSGSTSRSHWVLADLQEKVSACRTGLRKVMDAVPEAREERAATERELWWHERQAGDMKRDVDRMHHQVKIMQRESAVASIVMGIRAAVAQSRNQGPTGTVTLCFTDVQNSTLLWEKQSTSMAIALEEHNAVMRKELTKTRGYEVKTEGDAFFVSFKEPKDALLWCIGVQRALLRAVWPRPIIQLDDAKEELNSKGQRVFYGLRVRMGFNTGAPQCRKDPVSLRTDYFGPIVNLSARVAATGRGGEIVMGKASFVALQQVDAFRGCSVWNRGEHQLKGIDKAEQIFSVLPDELAERRFKTDYTARLEAQKRLNWWITHVKAPKAEVGDMEELRRQVASGQEMRTAMREQLSVLIMDNERQSDEIKRLTASNAQFLKRLGDDPEAEATTTTTTTTTTTAAEGEAPAPEQSDHVSSKLQRLDLLTDETRQLREALVKSQTEMENMTGKYHEVLGRSEALEVEVEEGRKTEVRVVQLEADNAKLQRELEELEGLRVWKHGKVESGRLSNRRKSGSDIDLGGLISSTPALQQHFRRMSSTPALMQSKGEVNLSPRLLPTAPTIMSPPSSPSPSLDPLAVRLTPFQQARLAKDSARGIHPPVSPPTVGAPPDSSDMTSPRSPKPKSSHSVPLLTVHVTPRQFVSTVPDTAPDTGQQGDEEEAYSESDHDDTDDEPPLSPKVMTPPPEPVVRDPPSDPASLLLDGLYLPSPLPATDLGTDWSQMQLDDTLLSHHQHPSATTPPVPSYPVSRAAAMPPTPAVAVVPFHAAAAPSRRSRGRKQRHATQLELNSANRRLRVTRAALYEHLKADRATTVSESLSRSQCARERANSEYVQELLDELSLDLDYSVAGSGGGSAMSLSPRGGGGFPHTIPRPLHIPLGAPDSDEEPPPPIQVRHPTIHSDDTGSASPLVRPAVADPESPSLVFSLSGGSQRSHATRPSGLSDYADTLDISISTTADDLTNESQRVVVRRPTTTAHRRKLVIRSAAARRKVDKSAGPRSALKRIHLSRYPKNYIPGTA